MDFFKKFNKLNLKDKDGKRRFISLVVTVFGIFLIELSSILFFLLKNITSYPVPCSQT